MRLRVTRSGRLTGSVRPPSDKSLTHRAYIFAMTARSGTSEIVGPLEGEDCQATLAIAEALGASVKRSSDRVLVNSSGRLHSPLAPLDCGNSGTTMRLMSGALAGQVGLEATLVGDASLSRRPMGRIVAPLRQMGARIEGETAPLTIVGAALKGIAYSSPVASAQVKSCLLLAGCQAEGETWITEPIKSRDHTERMMKGLGVDLLHEGRLSVGVRGGASWGAFRFSPPGDVSSAAFLLCATAMVPGSLVTLREVNTNPTRTGLLDVLRDCGVEVRVENVGEEMGEPFADLTVTGGGTMQAFHIKGEMVPRLIDEIPVLAVLATQCNGVTTIRDAKELRVKETDRIEVVASGLRAMGARVETYADGMDIEGPVSLEGARIDATGDHRIAMAFAVAGLVSDGETIIENADSIMTSYPEFVSHLRALAGDCVSEV